MARLFVEKVFIKMDVFFILIFKMCTQRRSIPIRLLSGIYKISAYLLYNPRTFSVFPTKALVYLNTSPGIPRISKTFPTHLQDLAYIIKSAIGIQFRKFARSCSFSGYRISHPLDLQIIRIVSWTSEYAPGITHLGFT